MRPARGREAKHVCLRRVERAGPGARSALPSTLADREAAEPTLDRERGTVRYRVSVGSGPVYTMGKLDIVRVSEPLRQAMLAEWKMRPGEVFREQAILNFYASQKPELSCVDAHVNCRYHLTLNEENHTVDVQLSLEKKP